MSDCRPPDAIEQLRDNALTARCERLEAQVAALVKYVQHTQECDAEADAALGGQTPPKCVCGLRDALDAVEKR